MPRDVFISYRSEDKDAANRICAALEAQDISCWIAPRDIRIGQEWATAIVEGLQRSKSFVLVLSSNSKNARQISREAELADQNGLPIITFRIEDVQPPPGLLYFLSNVQWLDAFGGQFDAAVARLAEVVRQSASYPAEKTGVHAARSGEVREQPRTDETTVQPVSAPAPTPPPRAPAVSPDIVTPAPVRKNSARSIAIAVASVVVFALAIWLFASRSRGKPSANLPDNNPRGNGPAVAKAVADRFVNDRDSGNFAAAWLETVPGFNNGVAEKNWIANYENSIKRNGRVQGYRSTSCRPLKEPDNYACEYTLQYANGQSSLDRITVKPKPDGSLGVFHSNVQAEQ